MAKEDKCFTKKNKNGGTYTTCVDKKGDQLREKDVKPKKKITKLKIKKKPVAKTRPKPPPPPGMSQADADVMVKDVLNYNKISSATKEYEKKENNKDIVMYKKMVAKMNAKPLQNVSAITAALSASAPKAAPPAANYNMLRPEIRKHIIGFIRGEEFSPSTMKKAQIDRMYEMIQEDNDFYEVFDERFSANMEYGGEYREGYFQDKYGDTIVSRYDRAETKFRKDTKRDFVKFLKAGGDSMRGAVPGKYDKKTIKELRDVYFDDY